MPSVHISFPSKRNRIKKDIRKKKKKIVSIVCRYFQTDKKRLALLQEKKYCNCIMYSFDRHIMKIDDRSTPITQKPNPTTYEMSVNIYTIFKVDEKHPF